MIMYKCFGSINIQYISDLGETFGYEFNDDIGQSVWVYRDSEGVLLDWAATKELLAKNNGFVLQD